MTWRRTLIGALLATIFVFYAVTLREGHIWDDDAAMYILHARNIAEGRAYADTGYIFNPEYPNLGPVAYPPGFPLLLAPIWAARGLDLNAMKMVGVGMFAASLALLYALFRKHLKEPECLVLIAIVGFCPFLWAHKDFVSSDLPFLAVLFSAMLAIDRAYSQGSPPQLWFAIPAGLLIAAACSVRWVGMVLLPSLIAYDWLRTRRLSTFAAAACAVAVAVGITQTAILHSAPPALFRIDPRLVVANTRAYLDEFTWLWRAGEHPVVARAFCGAVLVIAGWRFLARFRPVSGLRITELFMVFYAGVLLIYQANEARFLFPLYPLCVALAIEGIGLLLRKLPARIGIALALTLAAAWGLAAVAEYRVLNWGPIRESFLDQDFLRLTDFVNRNGRQTDILLFRKPRMLCLLTGRRAATYAHTPGLGEFVHTLPVSYVIAANSPAGTFSSDANFLWPYIEAHAGSLQLAYRNSGYSVYRVLAP
jgi:4-amino-4-deoxy-L-arabinose transferase-like glycosyltransferase